LRGGHTSTRCSEPTMECPLNFASVIEWALKWFS
jgi:hypothetical protein